MTFVIILKQGDAARKLFQGGGDSAPAPPQINYYDFKMNILIEGYFKEAATASVVTNSEITTPLEAFLKRTKPDGAEISNIADESEKILGSLDVSSLNVEDIFSAHEEGQSCVRGIFSKIIMYQVTFKGEELASSTVLNYYEHDSVQEFGTRIKLELLRQEKISENLILIDVTFHMEHIPDASDEPDVDIFHILFILTLIVFAIFLVISGCMLCHAAPFRQWKQPDAWWVEHGKPLRSVPKPLQRETVFVDGLYDGYYKQKGPKTDLYHIPLRFNKNGTIEPYGEEYPSDVVGSYFITGQFNAERNAVVLQKHYVLGTGDQSQNLGHIVRIRLHYSPATKRFQGKWMVNTHRYRGTGEFAIWLESAPTIPPRYRDPSPDRRLSN